MEPNSSNKKVIFGLDWIDLALGLIFIALIASVGYLVYPPYGWIPGAAIGLLMLYLAWRRRMGKYRSHDDTHHDTDPPLE